MDTASLLPYPIANGTHFCSAEAVGCSKSLQQALPCPLPLTTCKTRHTFLHHSFRSPPAFLWLPEGVLGLLWGTAAHQVKPELTRTICWAFIRGAKSRFCYPALQSAVTAIRFRKKCCLSASYMCVQPPDMSQAGPLGLCVLSWDPRSWRGLLCMPIIQLHWLLAGLLDQACLPGLSANCLQV